MSGKILVLDDEEKYAKMLGDLLTSNGFRAETITDPGEALRLIGEKNYELVVTDYKMPVMDGSEFLLEARKANPDLPVIIVSGLMNMPELLKVANIGVTLVLEKPFDPEEFLSQVGRFVTVSDSCEVEEDLFIEEVEEDLTEDRLYPSPTKYISDSSPENRKLLNTLWKGMSCARHLTVSSGTGNEFRLLGQEMLYWMGANENEVLPSIDLMETSGDLVKSWVRELDVFPSMAIVEVRSPNPSPEFYEALSGWVELLETERSDLDGKVILYSLPYNFSIDKSKLTLSRSLLSLVREDAPAILPLRFRIQDQAEYTRRRLSELGPFTMDAPAAELLLNHEWRGGYAELMGTINRMANPVRGNKIITSADLKEALADRMNDAVFPVEGGLVPYIRRRQKEFIEFNRGEGEDWQQTLKRLGFENDGLINPGLNLEEQPVLVPEVLEEVPIST